MAEYVDLKMGPELIESDHKLMVIFVDVVLRWKPLGNIFMDEVLDVFTDVFIDLYFFFGGRLALLCEVIDKPE